MPPSRLAISFYKPRKTQDIGKSPLHSRRHVVARGRDR
jgi:hypothetical protein